MEINEIEKRKTIDKINENKGWFFEKINKSDTSLDRLTKKKLEKTQTARIGNERVDVNTNFTEIKRIIKE